MIFLIGFGSRIEITAALSEKECRQDFQGIQYSHATQPAEGQLT
jgi:hypothetical protein